MKIQTILFSIAMHSAVILGGGAFLVVPAQYGVEDGSGGMDVDLIAAPAMEGAEDNVIKPETETVTLPAEEIKPAPEPVPAKVRGDGSSPIPGKDETTLHSSAGAVHQAEPKYLRNPAPLYPDEARRRGEEGLVLLSVDVTSSGNVSNIVIKNSSGYPVLDEAAVKAVKRWRFEPARAGSLRLDSRVEVPIRFQLTDDR